MASDAVVQGVSGAIGGVVATIATYPLMTVTTRQATRVKEGPGASSPGSAPTPPGVQLRQKAPRQSTLAELLEIVRTSGWQALFGGLGTALFGTTISQGIYFYLYSLLRAMAVDRRQPAGGVASQDITVAESLLIASLAGMGNVLLTNPIWMVATRMQAQRKRKDGAAGGGKGAAASAGVGVEGEGEVAVELPAPTFTGVCRSVYGEYGVRGFWNGVGASLVMVVNPTIQYALYEWLLKVQAGVKRRRQQGPAVRATALEVFVLSALAKAGATVLTYPLLTIKTRMYTASKGDKDMQYSGIADAAAQILRREGLAGYFKGLNSKIVQSVLAAALLFVCKEKITDFTRSALASTAGGKRAVSG